MQAIGPALRPRHTQHLRVGRLRRFGPFSGTPGWHWLTLALSLVISLVISLGVVALSLSLVVVLPAASVVEAATSGTEFRVDLDPAAHRSYGLHYPATYIFQIPPGSSGLQAQYRYTTSGAWTTLPAKTPSDSFNGVAAARFDYATRTLYLSVPFSQASDSIFLRVLAETGGAVSLTYVGIATYYDNRRAAVTILLDDLASGYLADFGVAVSLLASKGLHHTLGVQTGHMDTSAWGQLQRWIDQGFTEAASHTRTHPCSDSEYLRAGGYTSEVAGSRDDLLRNLRLPAPYVPAFLQPCGFESPSVRQAVVAARYLVDRHASQGTITFSPWSSDGAYASVGPTYDTWSWPTGGGSTNLRDQANAAFDRAYSNGGIYHLMDHPWKKLWASGSYLDQHAHYIAGRADVWYVEFGNLYLYHYLQERGKVSVSPASIDNPAP